MFVEKICLLMLLISSVLKANVISLFYAFMLIFYIRTTRKTFSMLIILVVIGLSIIYQYFVTLFNMTARNSPMGLPFVYDNSAFFPIILRSEFFLTHLDWAYYIGISIETLS